MATLLLAGKFYCNFCFAERPDDARSKTYLKIHTNSYRNYRYRIEYQTTTLCIATGHISKRLFSVCITAWHATAHITDTLKFGYRTSKSKLLKSLGWLCHARKNFTSYRSVMALLCAAMEILMDNSGHEYFEKNYVRWVTLEKCAQLVGYTKDALNALRHKGKLRMDIHWRKREGRIFIDMHAFQNWIETGR